MASWMNPAAMEALLAEAQALHDIPEAEAREYSALLVLQNERNSLLSDLRSSQTNLTRLESHVEDARQDMEQIADRIGRLDVAIASFKLQEYPTKSTENTVKMQENCDKTDEKAGKSRKIRLRSGVVRNYMRETD